MATKETKLSIVLRTVDKATAGINAINKRIDAVTKPIRDFGKSLGDLREKSGLDDVIGGFKGVGGAIAGVLGKVAMIGGVVGGAVAGLFHLVDGFDELGDVAERAGVGVEFLAQTRWAAQKAGASVEGLDRGMVNLSKSMGEMRAGGGPIVGFLKTVSPVLLRQLKATKSNEEAFGLLADAMAKIQDPAKRAIFAQRTLGDASLAPLLGKGAKGIQELRDRYAALAGPQSGAAAAAGDVGDAMDDLKAATDGIKAALVEGLAPALRIVIERLRAFFTENRTRIKEWAADLGKRLPGAIAKFIDIFGGVVDAVRPFVDSAGKLKVIAGVLAAVIVGPLVASVYSLGAAILATPIGWILAAIAALVAGAYLLIDNWDAIAAFFVDLWDRVTNAFGAAWDAIAGGVVAGLRAAAGLVMKVWEPVESFFVGLWDGITGVFQKAWDFIKGIVDNITGAVDAVVSGIESITDFFGDGGEKMTISDLIGGAATAAGVDLSGQAGNALGAARGGSTEARVTVDFANAPRGTKVNADPQSTAAVDLSVGYQMLGGM